MGKRRALVVGAVALAFVGGMVAAKLLWDKLNDCIFIVEEK